MSAGGGSTGSGLLWLTHGQHCLGGGSPERPRYSSEGRSSAHGWHPACHTCPKRGRALLKCRFPSHRFCVKPERVKQPCPALLMLLPEIAGWQRSAIFTVLFNHFIRFKGCVRQFQVEQEVWEAVVPVLCLCFGVLPDRPPRLRELGGNTRFLQGGCSEQDPDPAAWGWTGGILSCLNTSLSVLQLTCDCSASPKEI